ncbi:MAG: scpB [Chlorobi bacterium]|nr:scpB [Chlorobiota bacterium]
MAVSKQLRVPTDPEFLKPVIEALIFASEEPLSARGLIRLLAGDRDEKQDEGPAVDDAATGIADAVVMLDTAVGEDEEGATKSPAADGTVHDLTGAMESAELRFSGYPTKPGSVDQAYLRALIDELNGEYLETGRAFRIIEVAGGFQFATVRDYGEWVALLSKEKSRRRLSPAALETLAIIAYRQPASKPEIESIRGVNCDQVLVNLMEKNLIAISGRSEGVGRPLLYSTTDDFLRSFGLKGIGDLPKLREIEELMEEDAFSPDRVEVITVDADTDAEEIEARVGAAGHHVDGEDGTVVDAAAVQAGLFAEEHRNAIELADDDDGPDGEMAGDDAIDDGPVNDPSAISDEPGMNDAVESAESAEAPEPVDGVEAMEPEEVAETPEPVDGMEAPEAVDAPESMEAVDAVETADTPEAPEPDDREPMGDDDARAGIMAHR